MKIRPLEGKGDLQGVHRVNVLAWRAAYRELLPTNVLDDRSTELSEEEAKARLNRIHDANNCFLIAVDATETVRGYIRIRWGEKTKEFVRKHEAGLKEIYVEPDYWGRGVGTNLLENGLERLPDNIERVKLSMLAGNDRADQFYTGHGFEQTGTGEAEIAGDVYPTHIYMREVQ